MSSEMEPERPSLGFKQDPPVLPGATGLHGAAVVDGLLLKVFRFAQSTPGGAVCKSQVFLSTG